MAKEWSKYVNQKFYGADGGFLDNTEQIEFKSGRIVKYLKNSRAQKTIAVNLYLDDIKDVDGKTEFLHFLDWYENEIKCGTERFSLPDVVNKSGERKEYMLKEAPTWNGQGKKEVSLNLVEAF